MDNKQTLKPHPVTVNVILEGTTNICSLFHEPFFQS
jgi:hypothetical protein